MRLPRCPSMARCLVAQCADRMGWSDAGSSCDHVERHDPTRSSCSAISVRAHRSQDSARPSQRLGRSGCTPQIVAGRGGPSVSPRIHTRCGPRADPDGGARRGGRPPGKPAPGGAEAGRPPPDERPGSTSSGPGQGARRSGSNYGVPLGLASRSMGARARAHSVTGRRASSGSPSRSSTGTSPC